MAADGYYIYRRGNVVPRNVTRVRIDESLTVIPAGAFFRDGHIVELICHVGVKKVERDAFRGCHSLRIVIMPGVKVVERQAFCYCVALTDVECSKLEIIEDEAFYFCESLRSINLPSAKIVEMSAFDSCKALMNVEFGNKLESTGWGAFHRCTSLEQITIPLKSSIITHANLFAGCKKLKHVDLVEGAVLRDTIAALLLEGWTNDMNREILSIDQILSNTPAGNDFDDVGGKALAIRIWISSVLRKIIHYKAEHQSFLNEAASTLQHVLPQDIMVNNVLPFLELPSYMFEVGYHEEEEEDDSDY
eukprot:scaffold4355_cov81-Skeletonema_dohrnii-CCMP3373.AAC.4